MRLTISANDYINASLVDISSPDSDNHIREVILTQGPTPNTVESFWRMVFEDRSPVIAMLTEEVGHFTFCFSYSIVNYTVDCMCVLSCILCLLINVIREMDFSTS